MNQEFLQKLQALKQQYLDSLPGLSDKIRSCVTRLEQHKLPATEVDEFYRHVHSLTGSGATYGFTELSDQARTMENHIRELPDADDKRAEEITQHISVDYQLLMDVIEGITRGETAEVEQHDDEVLFDLKRWKILVADDDKFSRQQLAAQLEADGHTVVHAENGQQAIEQFRLTRPDMVVMDVVMPVMDGKESAKQIKQLSEEQFVPIIFLTSLESEEDLVSCIYSGGDDFLVKPFNRGILRARIFAMQRIQQLQSELEKYRQETESELNLARHVFDTATNRNRSQQHGLRVWREACGHFSGDVLCYTESSNGDFYLLLGDFTGHGLRAAIGALPTSDIFYQMAESGDSLEQIAAAINAKLKDLLPTGQFLCGTFIKIAAANKQVSVVNAGLPPVLVKRKSEQLEQLESSCLPLGIMESKHYEIEAVSIETEQLETLFVMSDGIIEASSPNGEMYGQARLEQQLGTYPNTEQAITYLQKDFYLFTEDAEPDDDISIVGISI